MSNYVAQTPGRSATVIDRRVAYHQAHDYLVPSLVIIKKYLTTNYYTKLISVIDLKEVSDFSYTVFLKNPIYSFRAFAMMSVKYSKDRYVGIA